MKKLLLFCCLGALFLANLGIASHAAGPPQPHPRTQEQATADDPEGQLPEAQEMGARVKELLKPGRYDEAQRVAKELLEKCEQVLGPEHPGTATALMLLGQTHGGRFRWAAALPLYKRALKIREKSLGPEHPETAWSLFHLARCYILLGNPVKGQPLAQRALRIREQVLGPEHPDTAASLRLLGYLYTEMGNHHQALRLLQRSLQIEEKVLGAEDVATAYTLAHLGRLYGQMGDPQKGVPLARRGAEILEKVLGLDNTGTAVTLKNLGNLYLALKDYSQAEACFRRARYTQGEQGLIEIYLATGRYDTALETLEKIAPPITYPRPQYWAQFYTQKGLTLMGLGRREEAAAAFLESINLIEDLRARSAGERTGFFEIGMIGAYFRAYRGMVALLAEMAQKGDPLPTILTAFGKTPGEAAFYFAEAIKARSLLEAMAAGAGRSAASALPADLAAQEKRLRGQRADLESQWEEVIVPHPGRERDLETFRLKKDSLRKAEQQFLAKLRRRIPRYAALHYPQPFKTAELPLKSGEVLLEYVLGEQESYLFKVEPGGKTSVHRLGLGQEVLEKRLGALLAPFRQATLRREDLQDFSLDEATALYKELLEPSLAGVASGTRLIIVPDGVLGAFPFEALVLEKGPDWNKSVLVGDRWPMTYSQSAAILALNRHLQPSRAAQPLFALGDCIYEKNSPRYQAYKSGQGQPGLLKHAGPEKALTMAATGQGWGRLEFPPLPETRQTVQDLAALFGVKPVAPQVLLDVLATESRVRQGGLEKYRYLFFGTHGFLADKLAGVQEPVLVLTQVENNPSDDGFLTFSEVLTIKLDAELVTLAACMTGVGQVMQGEGVLNFARAFQQAGARSVMVALWNIPVDESLKFYSTFYKALKEGKTKLQALQTARQAVRAKEPHPYFWSGLILHGEG
jgi:CHAT domain-containing protein